MPQLVSVLSSWDPVSANAFSAGELHGQILEYDYISPDYEDVCHSCFSFLAYSVIRMRFVRNSGTLYRPHL